MVTVLLHPYMPETATRLLAALGSPATEELAVGGATEAAGRLGARARVRRAARRRRVEKLPPLFPKIAP